MAAGATSNGKKGEGAKKKKRKQKKKRRGGSGPRNDGGGKGCNDDVASATAAAKGRWSGLPWRRVDDADAATPGQEREGEIDDGPFPADDGGYNHYDDPRADPDELFRDASTSAGMGMMFGSLEVVDGSLYEVNRGNGHGDGDDNGDDAPVATITTEDDGVGGDESDEGSDSSAAEHRRHAREDGDVEGEGVVSANGSSTGKEREGRRPEKDKGGRGQSESTAKDDRGTTSEPTKDADADADATPINDRQLRRREKRRLAKREKKARKKRARKEAEAAAVEGDQSNDATRFTEEEVSRLGEDWNASCNYGAPLHATLCRGLLSKGFAYPTPIQAATLPAACLGRRNVVGAAPTGSGKTLAYALPMLDSILTRRDDDEEEEDDGHDGGANAEKVRETSQTTKKMEKGGKTYLQGLVVCPTRELALQVRSEIRDVCLDAVGSVALVGGLSSQKQARVLNGPVRPEVVVATPGRLWELMSSGDHPHLRDFSRLRFVVVDEADRMVLQGSFPQLRDVFALVAGGGNGRGSRGYRGGGGADGEGRAPSRVRRNRSGRADDGDGDDCAPDDADVQGSDEDDGEDDDDNEVFTPDGGRLRSLAGVRGEARVTMLDDSILDMLERQRRGGAAPGPIEVDDGELMAGVEDDASEGSAAVGDAAMKEDRVQRQTFVYSATLTLPAVSASYEAGSSRRDPPRASGRRRGDGRGGERRGRADPGGGAVGAHVTGAIAEILDIVGARGQTKVVDLTSANAAADMVANDTKSQRRANEAAADDKGRNRGENGGPERDGTNTHNSRRLPPGLSLYEVKCTQRHKDSHCYAYLTTTRHGSSGPCLIFCNSIAGVRRVGETLSVLGLPVRTLHAQKAQKSRFKALETLRKPGSESRAIVVATDVAARGLDIPSVSTVIHYDVARTVDTFIHRSGRTARGVGEDAVGSSISLVSPGEEAKHRKILEAIHGLSGKGFTLMPIDGRLLSAAQERTALATKIVVCEAVQNKAAKQNKWFEAAAAEAEMETDERLLDQGLLGGSCRDRLRLQEAKQARADLQELLSRPMRKQNFGKFLSGAGLAAAVKAEAEVAPHVVQFNENNKKKRQRKP